MKSLKEKQLEIQLLTEKIERISGKKVIFVESLKTAKQSFLDKELISSEDFETLSKLDKTPTKKYIHWICDKFIKENIDIHALRNTVDEYQAFCEKNIIKGEQKDITRFATFKDLQKLVDKLNNEGAKSNSQLENDYEVLVSDDQMLAVSPHTHEASRKVGLKWFAVRKNSQTGQPDCPWCTTYGTDTHFNSYYGTNLKTFIYIRVSGNLKNQVVKECGKRLEYVALEISSNDSVNVWNMDDVMASSNIADKYLDIMNQYVIDNNYQDKF